MKTYIGQVYSKTTLHEFIKLYINSNGMEDISQLAPMQGTHKRSVYLKNE